MRAVNLDLLSVSGTSNILMLRNLSRSNEPLKCLLFRLEMQKNRNEQIGHLKHMSHRIVLNNNFEMVNFG